MKHLTNEAIRLPNKDCSSGLALISAASDERSISTAVQGAVPFGIARRVPFLLASKVFLNRNIQ